LSRLRDTLLPPIISLLGPTLVRSLGRSWKIRRIGFDPFQERQRGGAGRCIVTLWHCNLLPLAFLHRDEGATVLVSRHGDGELIVRALKGLGFHVARGSTTRGGAAGLRELVRVARRETGDLAITPDGPKGPAKQAQAGVVYLAALSGFPILPLALETDRAWRFHSWDRFKVPKPGARVAVVAGRPITIRREQLEQSLPEHLRAFEAEMERAERQARQELEKSW